MCVFVFNVLCMNGVFSSLFIPVIFIARKLFYFRQKTQISTQKRKTKMNTEFFFRIYKNV